MSAERRGSPDPVLLGEVLATIAACADMCVAAASPDTDLGEALRLRRIVQGQLAVAARLLFAVRRSNGIMKIDQGPAAEPPCQPGSVLGPERV